MNSGIVEYIFTAPERGAPVQSRQQVEAIPGVGLEGDRYAALFDQDTQKKPHNKREITLIEIENIEALESEHGLKVDPSSLRRNIVTRGVDLNSLVGVEFQVGEVRLQGIDLCEPCSYIEGQTAQGVLKALVKKGGLRAQIIFGGIVHVGDSVTT
jgi:MOSC domain-containing protein YiiM